MKLYIPVLAIAALAGGLAASRPAIGAAASLPPAAMIAAGRTAFARCSGCHAVAAGQNGLGPSLAGIVSRPIASVPGFAYSPALAAQKGAWTRQRIDAFLAAPQKAVPGTKMYYPGQSDPARRAELIAYLTTLR